MKPIIVKKSLHLTTLVELEEELELEVFEIESSRADEIPPSSAFCSFKVPPPL